MSAFLLLVLIILLVSGRDRLEVVGKGLGEGTKAFRKAWRDSEQAPPKSADVVVVSVQTNPVPAREAPGPEADPGHETQADDPQSERP